jgi:heat shock protein HtpX
LISSSTFFLRLRAWLLIAGLSGLLVGIGAMLGGGWIVTFAVIAVVMNLAMYWFSDRLALRASRAEPLEEHEAPELFEDVRDLSGRAGIPVPRLYRIPSPQPNAFACGRSPSHAAVAVTEGLVQAMPREQVRGVIAHELAHISNRDILVMTVASMLGAIVAYVAQWLQFSFLFGGHDDEDNPIGAFGAIAAALIAPIAAMLLQLAVSRQREYLADATAARIMGTGRPLARALETLQTATRAVPMQVNPATEALYIANPLSGRGVAALFSTHPPIEERVRRLLELESRLVAA